MNGTNTSHDLNMHTLGDRSREVIALYFCTKLNGTNTSHDLNMHTLGDRSREVIALYFCTKLNGTNTSHDLNMHTGRLVKGDNSIVFLHQIEWNQRLT